MSSTRFLLTLLALVLVFLGGGYAVHNWADMQARLSPAPSTTSAPATSSASTEATVPNAGSSKDVASAPATEAQSSSGTAESAAASSDTPKAETRMKKEFDEAAADAAAEAESAAAGTGTAATPPAASSTTSTRSIESSPTLVTVSLDAVQLSATGASVIAGQAPSGTKVTLLANDVALATVVTDDSGAWTMIIEEPVAPGTYKLKLAAVGPNGGEAVVREAGEVTVNAPAGEAVVAEVPAASSAPDAGSSASETKVADAAPAVAEEPAATLTTVAPPADVDVVVPSTETFDMATVPPDLVASSPAQEPVASPEATAGPAATEDAGGATTEAPAPATETAQAGDPSLVDQAGQAADAISDMFTDWLNATGDKAEEAAKSFSLANATYKPISKGKGVVTLSGHGPPKAEVRLFVDNLAVGTTSIADTGRWLAEADHWVEPGAHMARAEIIGIDGTVIAGHDLAFQSSAAPDVVVADSSGSGETQAMSDAVAPVTPILLAIADVAYENMGPKKGRITVGGRAEPSSRVAVFADGQSIGTADAAVTGDWTLASDTWIDVGAHAIRAERTTGTGEVVESTLTEFVRPPAEVEVASAAGGEEVAGEAIASAESEVAQVVMNRPKKLLKRKKLRLAAVNAKPSETRQSKVGRSRHKILSLVRGSEVARIRVRLGKRTPRVLGYLSLRGPGWYRVRRGDSLWRIADRCYGNGRQFPAILAANSRAIRNPDLIFPQQRLYVP